MPNSCQRAEILAGAIALREADDLEREEYRRHIAACSSCLDSLGGERGIERAMDIVHEARDTETWQPVLATIQSKNQRRLRAIGRFAVSAVGIAIIASLGIHVLIASSIGPIAATPSNPVVLNYDGTHITLEHRRPQRIAKAHNALPSHLLIVHNVVTLKTPPVVARTETAHSANADLKSTTVVAQAQPPVSNADESVPNVPIWRRDEPFGTKPTTSEKDNSAPVKLEGRAESIAIAPTYSIRDVTPIGGETAINPQPPMIAYSEGAEGTTAFAVSIDERGVPTKCSITQSSGSLVLDEAVCKAAMKARFSPRLVNGRPTASTYRDAFTFRNSTNNDGIDQPQL